MLHHQQVINTQRVFGENSEKSRPPPWLTACKRSEDKLWSALRTKGGQKATSRTKSAWLSQLEKSQAPKSSPKMVPWGPMLDWLGRKKSPMLRFLLSCTLHFSWTSAVLVAHCRTALPSAAECRLRRHSVAGLPLIWKVSSCEQHRSLSCWKWLLILYYLQQQPMLQETWYTGIIMSLTKIYNICATILLQACNYIGHLSEPQPCCSMF